MRLGRLLKQRRNLQGMSLEEVGDACGLSKSYLWEIENGRTTNIGLMSAIRLSISLNIPVSAMCAAALEPDDVAKDRAMREPVIVHGVNCEKEPHVGGGYLHGAADDSVYDVDGVSYCGRCHVAMGAQGGGL